jgi:hypothetical protein
MNAKFFEEQRQEMVAAIRAIAEHIAAELGKTALNERVAKVHFKALSLFFHGDSSIFERQA